MAGVYTGHPGPGSELCFDSESPGVRVPACRCWAPGDAPCVLESADSSLDGITGWAVFGFIGDVTLWAGFASPSWVVEFQDCYFLLTF